MAKRRVVVIGAGVAGMSAAHHLVRAGHQVTLLEKRRQGSTAVPELGGKAYSFTGPHGPAEHGFRFFPGFYRHVPDTMKQIPTSPLKSVADRLVGLRQAQISAIDDNQGLNGRVTISVPSSRGSLPGTANTLNLGDFDRRRVVKLLLRIVTMPHAAVVKDRNPLPNGEAPVRADDDVSWASFAQVNQGSKAYDAFFGIGLTRCFVATKAEEMSARTGVEILLQLIYDFMHLGPAPDADRALDRPTSTAWFEVWRTHLAGAGVTIQQREVSSLGFDPATNRINRITTDQGPITAFDDVVLATAVDDARTLVRTAPSLVAADPELQRLVDPTYANAKPCLGTDAMNGVIFYPNAPLAGLIEGHYLLVESAWALTAIYQSPKWWSTASANGQLSVIISDWHAPGSTQKAAEHLDDAAVAAETWKQIQQAVPELAAVAMPAKYTVDPARQPFAAGARPNLLPMLVNRTGAWRDRPHAGLTGKVANLVLAGDYVRATTDFASMETADETARRAVRVLIDRFGTGPGGLVAPPTVHDRLPAPRGLAAVRTIAGPVRRLVRLLGGLLDDKGRLGHYDPDSFAALFVEQGGFGPDDSFDLVDELPEGVAPVGPGVYDDRWLPGVLRADVDSGRIEINEIVVDCMTWARSVQQVVQDLEDRGHITGFDLVPPMKEAVEFSMDISQRFVTN